MHPQNNSAKDCAITPPPPLPLFIPPFYWQAQSLALYCVHLFFSKKQKRSLASSGVAVCVRMWSTTGVCALIWDYLVIVCLQNHNQFTCSYFLILLVPHPYFSVPSLHHDKYLTLSRDNNGPSSYAGVNGER